MGSMIQARLIGGPRSGDVVSLDKGRWRFRIYLNELGHAEAVTPGDGRVVQTTLLFSELYFVRPCYLSSIPELWMALQFGHAWLDRRRCRICGYHADLTKLSQVGRDDWICDVCVWDSVAWGLTEERVA